MDGLSGSDAAERNPQRTDAEILRYVHSQGAHAPRVKTTSCMTWKNKFLDDPPKPWSDTCIQAKGRDARHTERSNILLVIHFDEAVCGTHQVQPHFDFMIGTGMSAGTAWTSTGIDALSELGH